MKCLKSIVLASFIGLFGISASYAGGNPLIHECENYGGQFLLLAPGQSQDLPICIFGSASVGALDLVNHRAGCSDQAVDTFLGSQASDPSSVCAQNDAQEITGHNSGSAAYDLCSFPDGSTIDVHTLARGATSQQNTALINALQAPAEGPTDSSQTCQGS